MGLVGRSPAMLRVHEQIKNAARSEAPAIVLGESGTGKELVAAAIHALSRRKDGPFMKVNCAALNEHLLESELFGHRRGAFTGAMRDRQGRFEAASGGTIFLDEIGDMPAAMQAKLLRVLEGKEIERVGENTPIPIDVRLVSATNRSLAALVESGAFREDLLYRVNVIPIALPPLRERVEDIPLLVAHFLARIGAANDRAGLRVTPAALEELQTLLLAGECPAADQRAGVRRHHLPRRGDRRPGPAGEPRGRPRLPAARATARRPDPGGGSRRPRQRRREPHGRRPRARRQPGDALEADQGVRPGGPLNRSICVC